MHPQTFCCKVYYFFNNLFQKKIFKMTQKTPNTLMSTQTFIASMLAQTQRGFRYIIFLMSKLYTDYVLNCNTDENRKSGLLKGHGLFLDCWVNIWVCWMFSNPAQNFLFDYSHKHVVTAIKEKATTITRKHVDLPQFTWFSHISHDIWSSCKHSHCRILNLISFTEKMPHPWFLGFRLHCYTNS